MIRARVYIGLLRASLALPSLPRGGTPTSNRHTIELTTDTQEKNWTELPSKPSTLISFRP